MNDACLITQIWPGRHNEEMLAIVEARHRAYCLKHGFDYWVIKRAFTGWPQNEKTWERVILVRQALEEGYKYVVWMDADAIIRDFDTDLRQACVGIGAVYDEHFKVHHFNCGVMYFQNIPEVKNFVEEWRQRYPGTVWKKQRWHEQSEFNLMIPEHDGLIHRLDNKWNSYPTTPASEDDIIVKAWHGPIMWDVKIKEMKAYIKDIKETE